MAVLLDYNGSTTRVCRKDHDNNFTMVFWFPLLSGHHNRDRSYRSFDIPHQIFKGKSQKNTQETRVAHNWPTLILDIMQNCKSFFYFFKNNSFLYYLIIKMLAYSQVANNTTALHCRQVTPPPRWQGNAALRLYGDERARSCMTAAFAWGTSTACW